MWLWSKLFSVTFCMNLEQHLNKNIHKTIKRLHCSNTAKMIMKCKIQVHPLSSTVLIPIGLLLLLNYYILARSSTFYFNLFNYSFNYYILARSSRFHFNFPYWAAAATLVNLKVNKVFNKFQKLKNIGLNPSFFSSSVQFSTIFVT